MLSLRWVDPVDTWLGKHDLVERIEAVLAGDELLRGCQSAVDEDLTARGSVREADLLVRAKEVHLMGAGDGAAAQGVHADLAGRPRAHHALATVGDGRLAGGVDLIDILCASFLAGVGFTVSLLIAELSFPGEEIGASARLAVVAASTISAVLAAVALRLRLRTAVRGAGAVRRAAGV